MQKHLSHGEDKVTDIDEVEEPLQEKLHNESVWIRMTRTSPDVLQLLLTDCQPSSGDKTFLSGGLSNEVIKNEQLQDDDVRKLIQMKSQSREKPLVDEIHRESYEVQHLCSQWESLEILDGILYRKFESVDGTIKHWQIVVPKVCALNY